MANIPRFNTNLGLPATPEVTDPDMLAAVTPLYNAIRALAGSLDTYTGTTYIDPAEYAEQSPASSLIAANQAKIYLKCAAAITAGYTVAIDANGEAILGTAGTVIGFAADSGAIGEHIRVVLQGYWPINGVTPGTIYRAAAGGTITSAGATQALGRAISTSAIYFNPDLA